jgi:hypothetical protein
MNLKDSVFSDIYSEMNNMVGGAAEPFYSLVSQKTTRSTKFNIERRMMTFRLENKQFSSFFEAEEESKEFFQHLCSEYIESLSNDCKVRFFVNHLLFETPISTPLIWKEQFNTSIISSLFYGAVQSKKRQSAAAVSLADEMIVGITIAKTISGAGKRVADDRIDIKNFKRSKDYIQNYCDNKRSVFTIENFDNYCLVFAILIGVKHADGDRHWSRIASKPTKKLKSQVMDLVHLLKLPDLQRGLDIEHVKQIEHHLQDYQIIVYRHQSWRRPSVFQFKFIFKKKNLHPAS